MIPPVPRAAWQWVAIFMSVCLAIAAFMNKPNEVLLFFVFSWYAEWNVKTYYDKKGNYLG